MATQLTHPKPISAPRITRALSSLLGLVLLALLFSGCKLIFEPAEDATNRFLEEVAVQNYDKVDDFIDPEEYPELFKDVRRLGSEFGNPRYSGKTKYWRVVNVEEDESNGLTFVDVEIDVPPSATTGGAKSRRRSTSKKTKTFTVTFEMERKMLVWHIYEIYDIGKVLREFE